MYFALKIQGLKSTPDWETDIAEQHCSAEAKAVSAYL